MVRTSLPIMGWVEDMFHQPSSAMVQTSTLMKCHAYLQQRNTLSSSPLSLKMWSLLDPVECVDPPAPLPLFLLW